MGIIYEVPTVVTRVTADHPQNCVQPPQASWRNNSHVWQNLLRPISSRISSHFGLHRWKTDPGLRRKDWILRALLLVVTSLWAHKVGSSVEIYSARWKFMLISDQAKDLVKNCFEGGGSMSPFQQIYPFILEIFITDGSLQVSKKF